METNTGSQRGNNLVGEERKISVGRDDLKQTVCLLACSLGESEVNKKDEAILDAIHRLNRIITQGDKVVTFVSPASQPVQSTSPVQSTNEGQKPEPDAPADSPGSDDVTADELPPGQLQNPARPGVTMVARNGEINEEMLLECYNGSDDTDLEDYYGIQAESKDSLQTAAAAVANRISHSINLPPTVNNGLGRAVSSSMVHPLKISSLSRRKHERQTFTCYKCKERIVCVTNFEKHMMEAHSIGKPWECRFCPGRRFHRLILLEHHYNTMHKNNGEGRRKYTQRQFICDICHDVITYVSKFEAHMLEKHGVRKPWRCDQCVNYAAATYHLYMWHVQQYHPNITKHHLEISTVVNNNQNINSPGLPPSAATTLPHQNQAISTAAINQLKAADVAGRLDLIKKPNGQTQIISGLTESNKDIKDKIESQEDEKEIDPIDTIDDDDDDGVEEGGEPIDMMGEEDGDEDMVQTASTSTHHVVEMEGEKYDDGEEEMVQEHAVQVASTSTQHVVKMEEEKEEGVEIKEKPPLDRDRADLHLEPVDTDVPLDECEGKLEIDESSQHIPDVVVKREPNWEDEASEDSGCQGEEINQGDGVHGNLLLERRSSAEMDDSQDQDENRMAFLQSYPRKYTIRKFMCELCGIEIRHTAKYERHMFEMHNVTMPYKCNKCSGRRFMRLIQLQVHEDKMHSRKSMETRRKWTQRQFQCPICQDKITYVAKYQQHMILEHGVMRMFDCRVCGHAMGHYHQYQDHMRTYHPNASVRHYSETESLTNSGSVNSQQSYQPNTSVRNYSETESLANSESVVSQQTVETSSIDKLPVRVKDQESVNLSPP